MKWIVSFLVLIVLVVLSWYYIFYLWPKPNPPSLPFGGKSNTPTKTYKDFEVIVENLEVPWDMTFFSDGRMLVTERPGRVLLVTDSSITQVKEIKDVKTSGESGLHGVALDPAFDSNHFVYLYYTYGSNKNDTINKVVRYKFENNNLIEDRIVIDKIPGAIFHDGGRIRFGPDNLLYITTGDASKPSLAQDKNSLAGKILRLTRDGEIPHGNPFDNAIYSYGHRNPQGIIWDDTGQLWATEHGDSTHDEVNKIIKGGNYGWPEIEGNETRKGMISPVLESGNETWAPAGAAFMNGRIYFTGLRGTALYSFNPKNPQETFKTLYDDKWGRLRNAVLHEGGLFVSTSNRDGRGVPEENDDKIIRIDSSLFK